MSKIEGQANFSPEQIDNHIQGFFKGETPPTSLGTVRGNLFDYGVQEEQSTKLPEPVEYFDLSISPDPIPEEVFIGRLRKPMPEEKPSSQPHRRPLLSLITSAMARR